jgi:hypothetical protein
LLTDEEEIKLDLTIEDDEHEHLNEDNRSKDEFIGGNVPQNDGENGKRR